MRRMLPYDAVVEVVGELPANAFVEASRSLSWVEAALARDRALRRLEDGKR